MRRRLISTDFAFDDGERVLPNERLERRFGHVVFSLVDIHIIQSKRQKRTRSLRQTSINIDFGTFVLTVAQCCRATNGTPKRSYKTIILSVHWRCNDVFLCPVCRCYGEYIPESTSVCETLAAGLRGDLRKIILEGFSQCK